jgi:hypothetical protein
MINETHSGSHPAGHAGCGVGNWGRDGLDTGANATANQGFGNFAFASGADASADAGGGDTGTATADGINAKSVAFLGNNDHSLILDPTATASSPGDYAVTGEVTGILSNLF